MRPHWLGFFVGLALALLPVLGMAADDAKPLVVELKEFSFKVPEEKAALFGHNTDEERLFFYTNGTAEAKIKVPEDGDYQIVVKASCDQAQDQAAKFKVAVDGKPVGKETEASAGEPKEHKFATPLKAGEHKLSVEFTNDVFKEGEYDRNLYVYAVALKKG